MRVRAQPSRCQWRRNVSFACDTLSTGATTISSPSSLLVAHLPTGDAHAAGRPSGAHRAWAGHVAQPRRVQRELADNRWCRCCARKAAAESCRNRALLPCLLPAGGLLPAGVAGKGRLHFPYCTAAPLLSPARCSCVCAGDHALPFCDGIALQELHWYKIPKDLPIAAAATMVVKWVLARGGALPSAPAFGAAWRSCEVRWPR